MMTLTTTVQDCRSTDILAFTFIPLEASAENPDELNRIFHICFCDQQKLLGPSRNREFQRPSKRQSCRAGSARLGVSFREALRGACEWRATKSRSSFSVAGSRSFP